MNFKFFHSGNIKSALLELDKGDTINEQLRKKSLCKCYEICFNITDNFGPSKKGMTVTAAMVIPGLHRIQYVSFFVT